MNKQKLINSGPLGKISNRFRNDQFYWVLLKSALIGVLFIKALRFGYYDLPDKHHTLVDFHTFHIAGNLALEGRLGEAYHASLMREAQIAQANEETFMPWAYPLPFNLVTALLALLPIGLSYLVFSGISLLSFFSVLKALLGTHFRLAVFLIIPALLVNLSCGQNGLLTAALTGLFCYGYLRRETFAGIPLGLMIIKPHLVAGIAVHLIIRREWRFLFIAGTTSLGLLILATGVFGPKVWNDYFFSINEATQFLRQGLYPMHRMASAFSTVLTVSSNYDWARLAQINSILAALGVQLWAFHQKLLPQSALGLSCIASTLYSPYLYDYDLTILGLGIGLLLPTLQKQLRGVLWILLAVLLLFTESGWFVQVVEQIFDVPRDQQAKLSLSFLCLPPLIWLCIVAINRETAGVASITSPHR